MSDAVEGPYIHGPDFIELRLTESQIDQISPLIRSHSSKHRNVLFVASIGPDAPAPWRLQVMAFEATRGHRVLKAIRQASALPVAAVDTPVQESKTAKGIFYPP